MTLAQASRERRDIVTGEVMEEAALVRFVAGPDGVVVPDLARKLLAAFRKSPRPPQLIGLFTADELGLALGGANVIHTAFLAGRSAERWTSDARRLSGFRPLFPESWREEP